MFQRLCIMLQKSMSLFLAHVPIDLLPFLTESGLSEIIHDRIYVVFEALVDKRQHIMINYRG